MRQIHRITHALAFACLAAASSVTHAQTGACCNPSTAVCTATGNAAACAALAPLAGAYFGDGSACPTFCEREANSIRADTVGFGITVAPGDTIGGFSSGTTVTSGVSTANTVDVFDITTTSAPSAGAWRYRLALTSATPAATMTVSIRGLSQSAGVIGATDIAVQTGSTSAIGSLPARTVQWYASEAPSRIYYRVTGSGTATPYTVTLVRDPVTVQTLPSPVDAGPVFVSTQGLTTLNTDMWLYTSALAPIVDAGNDTFVSGTQCRLERSLAAGTYIAAISGANLANNLASPADDGNRTGTVMDFPNAICCGLVTAPPLDCDFEVGNRCSGTVQQATNQTADAFEVTFWQFTTTGPTLPDPPYLFTAGSPLVSVLPGGSTLLTVTATSGTPAPVTANLSAFGLSAAEALHDDGLNGDATAGDNIWSYLLNVGASQTPGAYSFTVTGPSGTCQAPLRTLSVTVRPSNNSCANAIPITVGGSYVGTTLGAQGAGGLPASCNTITGSNSGVWYTFTEGPTPRRLSANLCDPVTDFDAQMVLYSVPVGGGCPGVGTGPACVWGNDTSGVGCPTQNPILDTGNAPHSNTPAILNWNPNNAPPGVAVHCTVPNTTYLIVVMNRVNTVGGHFVLHLDDTGETCEGTPPAHNTCAAARTLSAFPTWDVVFRGDVPGGLPDVSCNDTNDTNSTAPVWYTYTPAEPGDFFHAKIPDQGGPGTSTYTAVAVYSAASGRASLSEVACLAGPEGYTNAFTTPVTHLSAGTAYYIMVSSFSSTVAIGAAETLGFKFVADSGACCTGTTCTLSNGAASCASGGGVFIGYATTCSLGTCSSPAGVCCRGATCNASVAQVNCAGAGTAGAFYATSSAICNAGGATAAPCCYADYNKTGGISVQDIFDFLADWFGGNPFANTGGNGSPGALSVQNIFDFLGAWFAGGC